MYLRSTSETVMPKPLIAPGVSEARWYAAYTAARHEKRVAEQLANRSVEAFLPLYEAVHRWKDRRKKVQLPLFPGYLFIHMPLDERLKVLSLPGVVRLVGFNGRPSALLDADIEAMRLGLRDLRAEPHPYLKVGQRVRVRSGSFEGWEGILVRKKETFRVVLSIDMIMRSIAVEVDSADVEPVKASSRS